MIKQKTIARSVSVSGKGVHSGHSVHLTLHPAPIDEGVVFRRVDGHEPISIPAVVNTIANAQGCTSLEKHGTTLATVEHMLAALSGLNIDNIYIDVDAPEIPIMDGSAYCFVQSLQSAGIEEQAKARRYLRILRPVCVEDSNKTLKIEPYDGFKMHATIGFEHPLVQQYPQQGSIDLQNTDDFIELSKARTFGFLADYEYLKTQQLAQGADLDNVVVIGEDKVINPEGLRFPDELVKHKMLDMLGDLYLIGSPLLGSVTAYRTGHALNHLLLHEILAQEDAWEYVS